MRRTEGLQPWRRAFHFAGGLAVAWLVSTLSPQSAATRFIFGSLLAVALLGDLLRLRSEALNRIVFRVFHILLRPREVGSPSLTWYMLGVFLVLWIPDEASVVPALLVLAVADPMAGLVGQTWGSHAFGKGSVEGSLAFFLTAVGVLIPFVGIVAALGVAVVATVAEMIPTPLDDNLLIPVITALSLWAF
ncbi:MAG: diacylglycerol/polyprenol kinase family protein [Thermoanaerobaculales bacterium]